MTVVSKYKTLLVAIIAVIIAIVFFYKFPNESINSSNHQNLDEQDSQVKDIAQNLSYLHPVIKDQSHLTDYDLHKSCGFSENKFHESMDGVDYNSMSELELAHIEKTLVNCEDWFENLAQISSSELNQIKLRIREKNQILRELNTLSAEASYDVKIISKAKTLVQHQDPDISASALLYLLTYDNEFINKVGEEMGTSDVSFLRANLDLSVLYSCQKGLDCQSDSALMQDMCVIDESSCNLSFNAWLRQNKTMNQYDDMIISLNIINSIISSNWFEQTAGIDSIE